MIITATHPTLGTKTFSPENWSVISKWPDKGGWSQVKDAPAELEAPKTPAKKIKK